VPTEAERKLWWHLRYRLSTHFRRQVRIDRFIVDFACHAMRIIVEVDGGHRKPISSGLRTHANLASNGYRVLGYWKNEVLRNIDGVLQDIQNAISEKSDL
jgi:very-short-patch-repair endonuclease